MIEITINTEFNESNVSASAGVSHDAVIDAWDDDTAQAVKILLRREDAIRLIEEIGEALGIVLVEQPQPVIENGTPLVGKGEVA